MTFPESACVLLSGGMDSVAALMWARGRYGRLFAILFDYGQPNRDQELTIAGQLATEIGVSAHRVAIADVLPRGHGILARVVDDDGILDGVSPAFVPGRNLVFLASAAAHACSAFPNGNIDLVIGANAHDARRFPDCRAGALLKLGEALRHGIGRQIGVVAPWVDRTKVQILSMLDAEGRTAALRSWSCYRGDGPCGKCSPCVLRASAIAEAGLVDACARASMTGGDPHRTVG